MSKIKKQSKQSPGKPRPLNGNERAELDLANYLLRKQRDDRAQKTLQGNPGDQPLPARKEINRGPILRKYDA